MNKDTKQLSIKELLSSNEEYFIPIYQRNYAWEEGEINQLLQDIIDYLPKNQNYYIGTLVVHQRPNATFETIDGQQRLTTLSLLAAYLKRDKALNIAGCDTISLYPESVTSTPPAPLSSGIFKSPQQYRPAAASSHSKTQ